MIDLRGRQLTGKTLADALSRIDDGTEADECDLSSNQICLADVPVVVDFTLQHPGIKMIRLADNKFSYPDLYNKLVSMVPPQDTWLDLKLTCASSDAERQLEKLALKALRQGDPYDKVQRTLFKLAQSTAKNLEYISTVMLSHTDEVKSSRNYHLNRKQQIGKDVYVAARSYFVEVQECTVVDTLDQESAHCIIKDERGEPDVEWDSIFMVEKNGKRVLVLVQAKPSLQKEELVAMPAQVQKTLDLLRDIESGKKPQADSPPLFKRQCAALNFFTQYQHVAKIIASPYINEDLVEMAEQHGILCLSQDGMEYVMQPSKEVAVLSAALADEA